jgi:hypothetical protein
VNAARIEITFVGRLKMFRKTLLCAVLIAGSTAANAGPVIFSEGFDSVGSLGAAGWASGNFSTPGGESSWFQGNTGIFDSQAGSADSYVAANYLSAGFGGNVDNWLVTPLISASNGGIVTFSTRTAGDNPFGGDNLELLFSSTGSLNANDYVSLGTIGSAAYPTDWTAYSFSYGASAASVRFAFRYTVTDTSTFGDYIGIDSLSVAVPEPGTMMLLGAGLLLMPLTMRRRRREQS